jgi:hypothetical protein
MAKVMMGNKREVPPDIPVGTWWNTVEAYQASGRASALPWYDPQLEYLTPDQLARIRAKALVWWEVTGEFPKDITCWWEIRTARKGGYLPLTDEVVNAWIDADGTLHCGYCEARWSANKDGSPHADRCFNLCGRRWVIIEDAREVTHG